MGKGDIMKEIFMNSFILPFALTLGSLCATDSPVRLASDRLQLLQNGTLMTLRAPQQQSVGGKREREVSQSPEADNDLAWAIAASLGRNAGEVSFKACQMVMVSLTCTRALILVLSL